MRKIRIISIFIILIGIIGLGIVGSVSADPDPCPPPKVWSGKMTDNQVVVTSQLVGNIETIFVQGVNKNPIGGIPGIMEVCKSPLPSTNDILTAAPPNWGVLLKTQNNPPVDWAQFSRNDGNPDNIPMNGNQHTVGTINFGADPIPKTEDFLVHINDPVKCLALYPNGDPDSQSSGPGTCFIFQANTAPVPELSPTVLTATGLFGLIGIVMVSRKYKKA